MAKIFISYRREDSQYQTDKLYDLLSRHVSNPREDIFLDVDNIPFGLDFVEYLDGKVSACEVLLAVISKGWLEARDPATGQRRIDDPKDFVRIEIASALKRGIPVVPVLLDDTPVPSADDLPEDLQPLARRNGIVVTRRSFDADVATLVNGLPIALKPPAPTPTPPAEPVYARTEVPEGSKPARGLIIGGLATLAFIAGGGTFYALDPMGWRALPAPVVTERAPEPARDASGGLADVAGDIARDVPEVAPLTAQDRAATEAAARSDAIRDLQRALQALGLYTSGIDGSAGPGTRAAASRFASETGARAPELETAAADDIAAFTARVEAETIRRAERESAAWGIAQRTDTIPAYRSYLADYPSGVNASAARSRIAALTPPPEPATRVGQTFRDSLSGGGRGPEMVVVPSGSFTMGSLSSEKNRSSDEGPERTVRINYQFAVGKTEVTVAQYKAFADATGRAAGGNCYADLDGDGSWSTTAEANWTNTGFAQSGTHPVACLSFEDAQAYAEWLGRQTGEEYRLLTEAEFEYANRSGTTSAYVWGTDQNAGCRDSNGADSSAKRTYSGWTTSTCNDGHVHTAPVGSFRSNAFGLYDMTGNVWEWTQDCYADSYSGAPTDGSARIGGDCSRRVLRGGSWDSNPIRLRSANRSRNYPTNRKDNAGFRAARTL